MVLVELHPHARERASERETTEEEIVETVRTGESYPVKFGRMGFRKTFKYARIWRGRRHANKEVSHCGQDFRGMARPYGDYQVLLRARYETVIRSNSQHCVSSVASTRNAGKDYSRQRRVERGPCPGRVRLWHRTAQCERAASCG